MTTALQLRDRVLQAVRFAAQQFLGKGYSDEVIRSVLERLLTSAEASRVYVFQNHTRADGALLTSYRHETIAPGVSTELGNPERQSLVYFETGFALSTLDVVTRPGVQPANPLRGVGRSGSQNTPGVGRWRRCPRPVSGQGFRPVLHHQASRTRHWPGPEHLSPPLAGGGSQNLRTQ